ncbi:MAG: DUF1460 domain-containing protein [Bacteroidales bacterium]|nr:DUF1460 domain-containing protein [Bacteroidales bacterium]
MSTPGLLATVSFLLFFSFSCQSAQPVQEKEAPPEKAWQQWCPGTKNLEVFFSESDSILATEVMHEVSSEIPQASIPELIVALSEKFMGTPYVAHTLEVKEPEQLVINVSGMDCTTFVEQMLAMALAIQQGDGFFEDFAQILACIRYRDGIIEDYPSRLHYFTEWLNHNAEKGILDILSNEIGMEPFRSKVSFMTNNPGSYRQLENPAFVEKMKKVEKKVSSYEMQFIPKGKIRNIETKIKDGDIIAFTTDIDGLDVSHTGFAIFQNDRLHLLHASTRTNMVEISPVTLDEYLAPLRRVTGILVARVK